MEASTFRNHIVLCGLGRVGYRIARELIAAKESVVVIERNPDSMFVEELQQEGVPVLIGEARLKKNLLLANLLHARGIIVATDDDLTNLDAALTARELKPQLQVVLRLFDDTLADKVAAQFKMPVISTSQAAAGAFVAALGGRVAPSSAQLDGQTVRLGDLRVQRLPSTSVAGLQKEFGVSILIHKKGAAAAAPAEPASAIAAGDVLLVAGTSDKMARLEEMNRA